jgi:cold shock CspA family protein
MRYKGKLKNWKDDKGFGFIEPCLGGNEVFVHIKSFQNRSRRPEVGELVSGVNYLDRLTSITLAGFR